METQPQVLSIVIPARDEELNLPRCIASIRESENKMKGAAAVLQIEILVVANRCTDGTERVAYELGASVIRSEAKNLAAIRNAGVRAARGEYIITIDADSRMSSSFLTDVWRVLQDTRNIGGGVLILPERWSVGIFVSMLILIPIAAWYRISGGAFFCRRPDFEAVDGFPEHMFSAEDIAFAVALRRYAEKTQRRFRVLFRAHIITSCRKFDLLGDWYFVRNIGETIRLLRGTDRAAADRIWYDIRRS